MKHIILLLALLMPVGALAIVPSTGPGTVQKTMVANTQPQQQSPTEAALAAQLAELQEENASLTGQLDAERMKSDRIASDKAEVDSDLAKMKTERNKSKTACGDDLDPQKLRNVMGFTIATLVESGLGTATNVVQTIRVLKNYKPAADISGTPAKQLTVGGQSAKAAGADLGAGRDNLATGMAIASTALSVASTVTAAIAHKNLQDIRENASTCKGTFGTWY